MIGEDERYDYAHFRVHHARHAGGARADARAGAPDLALVALRDGRGHDGLHQAGREGQIAQRPGGLQRVAPAAFRRAGRVHRQLPGQRDGAAQHQPAAPELAQGGAGRDDDGRRVSAHRLQARGDHRPPDARHHLQGRRAGQGEPADPPARGRRIPVGGAAGRRAGLGGQRPRLLPARDEDPQALLSATSGWPRAASAAPNTCCPRW
jgi:hypothetical protein